LDGIPASRQAGFNPCLPKAGLPTGRKAKPLPTGRQANDPTAFKNKKLLGFLKIPVVFI
jgi:hypothetical protein